MRAYKPHAAEASVIEKVPKENKDEISCPFYFMLSCFDFFRVGFLLLTEILKYYFSFVKRAYEMQPLEEELAKRFFKWPTTEGGAADGFARVYK